MLYRIDIVGTCAVDYKYYIIKSRDMRNNQTSQFIIVVKFQTNSSKTHIQTIS